MRNSSVGSMRSAGPSHHQGTHGSISRHHPPGMMPPLGAGGGTSISTSGEVDPVQQPYLHPPLQRIHSQGTAVTVIASSNTTGRIYPSSRHSDSGSVSGNRLSLDSGVRYYDPNRHGGGSGGIVLSSGQGGYHPGAMQSMASNSGSGSGSSGVSSALGSAHDTRSFGAWSAPGGRSGGAVGSVEGGGGGWAAEHDQRSSFRGEGSGDEEDIGHVTPSFAAPHRRRSTGGGGGGPVVLSGRDAARTGRSEDVMSGNMGGADVRGGGAGSDLGSAGSPQFAASRASGALLGAGLWTGSFPPREHALSPQPASEQAEVHSLLGVL